MLVLSVPYPVHSSESGQSGILYFYLSCLCWIRFCECFVSKSYILYYCYLRVIISNLSLELSPILYETGFSLCITLLLILFLISTRLSWGYGIRLIDLILHYIILKIGVLGLFLFISIIILQYSKLCWENLAFGMIPKTKSRYSFDIKCSLIFPTLS